MSHYVSISMPFALSYSQDSSSYVLALTHLTGRRMIPSLDHRRVYWWGEKSNLSIMDLDTLKVSDYPISSSNPSSKLITYDILVINQKVVFVMEEAGVYGMVYLYDLLSQSIVGNWTYTNDDCNFFLTCNLTKLS